MNILHAIEAKTEQKRTWNGSNWPEIKGYLEITSSESNGPQKVKTFFRYFYGFLKVNKSLV
jgi:hypothetical protein